MPLESIKPEHWPAWLALAGASLAAFWRGIRLLLGLHDRVEDNKRELERHIDDCSKKTEEIRATVSRVEKAAVEAHKDAMEKVEKVGEKVEKLADFLMREHDRNA